jgi:ribosomal protein S27AE
MLTSFQASPVAYWADQVDDVDHGSGPYCGDCADHLAGGLEESGDHDELMIHYYRTPRGFQPASRYGVEEAYGCYGVDCERCGEPIVEPDHGWLDAGEECPECGHVVELDEHEAFDPNPPVPRWVPCGSCGAGDGEPHRPGCRYLGGAR